MTLEERLNKLYPITELNEEELQFLRKNNVPENSIKFLNSNIKFGNTINEKLREAYLLGRNEKDLY